MTAKSAILEQCAKLGWQGAVVPMARRAEAIERIDDLHRKGELDDAFYQEYLAPMFAEPLPETLTPRSLVLVAVPDRPVRMHFALDGETFEVLTAPGYLRAPDPRPSAVIAEILKPFGHSIVPASAPLKTLGTMSGFSRYGRNNISYVPGLGSLTALAGFVSDLECDDAPAQTQEALPSCASCGACRAACPTGAIGDDRFLLHAERCVTFWNEKDPSVPFPDWIDPRWHNAFLGCLHCQRVCPENRHHLGQYFEGPAFDEATTRLLLAGATKEEIPPEVVPSLEAWRLMDLLAYLPRNLGAVLRAERLRREGGDMERGERR